MGLGKAEYQNLFERRKTAKKNYQTRGRTSDFFWGGDAVGVDIGTGVRSPRSHQRTQLVKPPPSPAGRPACRAEEEEGEEGEETMSVAAQASQSAGLIKNFFPVARAL